MQTESDTEVLPLSEVSGALSDCLAWLVEMWRERIPPDRARRRLAELQAAHRELDIDLVWEREDYSDSVHYDLLIRAGEQGTVSLSFCPDEAVPWPLRNAFRASDSFIVRVNGRTIDAATAMTTMDAIWDRTDLVQGLVNLALVNEAVTRRGLTVPESEIQQAMDAFRRRHRLLTKADTYRYFEEHGLTQTELEGRLEAQILEDKLRDMVTEGNIEAYFEAHRADFETAHVARFRVADEAEARRIAAELRERPEDFFAAAEAQFLAAGQTGPTFAVLRRGALTAAQADAVFHASPGEIVVAPAGTSYDVVRVIRMEPARLDDSTRDPVRRAAFDAWLADARKRAQITWFWGDAQRLPNRNNGWAQ